MSSTLDKGKQFLHILHSTGCPVMLEPNSRTQHSGHIWNSPSSSKSYICVELEFGHVECWVLTVIYVSLATLESVRYDQNFVAIFTRHPVLAQMGCIQ